MIKLPGIAERIAYDFYDEQAFPIFTFGAKYKDLNIQIRDQLIGKLI